MLAHRGQLGIHRTYAGRPISGRMTLCSVLLIIAHCSRLKLSAAVGVRNALRLVLDIAPDRVASPSRSHDVKDAAKFTIGLFFHSRSLVGFDLEISIE